MFGYIVCIKDKLDKANLELYQHIYCGLCRNLKNRYGQLHRLNLSYDMTFIILLLSSLYEPEETETSFRCSLHPTSQKTAAENKFTDYAADMTILLSYFKCMDDWKDEGKHLRHWYASLLKKEYQRLKTIYPRQCRSVSSSIQALENIETKDPSQFDQAINLSGEMLSEIFVYHEDFWSTSLKSLGFEIGRFIYLMDASMDYEKDKKKQNYNPLFHVSVIEIGEGVIEVLATAGDNHLGGDDFDERITQWLLRRFKDEHKVDLSRDFAAMQRIRDAAGQAKKELSVSDSSHIMLPYLTEHRGEQLHMDLTLTRTQFEDLVRDLIDRTAEPVRSALNDAGIAPSELGRVLLVGGSTRIPAVQEKVRMLTGKEPSKNINPDECVAKGAAILGHTLEGNSLIASGTDKGILLLDVTPLSLSIETVGGVATRLIERNTTLPTRYSRIFSTAAPYQRSVDIHVLQGERPMARDNKTIGKFRLKGIKAAPAGVPQIEVTFDIDANGILKVSAKDLDTGKQQSITITANDSMSEQEIQQAIRDAHEYAGQDQTRKDAMEVLSDVQRLMSETEQKLKAQKKTLDHGTKKQIKNDLNRLNKLAMKCRLDKVSDAQLAELKEAKQKLEDSAAALS